MLSEVVFGYDTWISLAKGNHDSEWLGFKGPNLRRNTDETG